MNILLIVVSDDKHLLSFVGKSKDRIFPSGAFSKGPLSDFEISSQVNSVAPADFPTVDRFEDFVNARSKDAQFLIILIQKDFVHLVERMHQAAIVCEMDASLAAPSYLNFLHSVLKKAARALGYLAALLKDARDLALVSLPTRNFDSQELRRLCQTSRNNVLDGDFQELFDADLKLLRQRVRPRKSSSYREKYAVDDKGRFFVYGKERHSRPESGEPHKSFCVTNARFRFGVRIDETRHFNVSEGEGDTTFISGTFVDCHDTPCTVSGRSHLNIFSNDYFS